MMVTAPQLSATSIAKNGKLIVTVTVTNSGSRSGDEVVQLYIRDHAASIVRPVKELKGFEKITLKAGESKTVSSHLLPQSFHFILRMENSSWNPENSVYLPAEIQEIHKWQVLK